MYQLEQFATGRFDVRAENGARAGSILGGAGNWCAEVGNRVVGYYPTVDAAAKAILADRGIVGIYEQMTRIIQSTNRLQQAYFDDFSVHDLSFIGQWGGATSVLWVVRPLGTHLVALDMPMSSREGLAVLRAVHPDLTGTPWDLYIVDCETLQVKAISEAQAGELVLRPPKYGVTDESFTAYGKSIATVRRSHAYGEAGVARKSHLTIDCTEEPSKQRLVVLKRLAFFAGTSDVGGGYGAAASITINFDGNSIFRWSPNS